MTTFDEYCGGRCDDVGLNVSGSGCGDGVSNVLLYRVFNSTDTYSCFGKFSLLHISVLYLMVLVAVKILVWVVVLMVEVVVKVAVLLLIVVVISLVLIVVNQKHMPCGGAVGTF